VVWIRRRFGEVLISIAALGVLLAVLISVDDRVREQVGMRFNTAQAKSDLAGVGAQAHDLAGAIFSAARHQSIEHAPLMIFVFSATVLVVFMLRT
jgi:hypothetical protein